MLGGKRLDLGQGDVTAPAATAAAATATAVAAAVPVPRSPLRAASSQDDPVAPHEANGCLSEALLIYGGVDLEGNGHDDVLILPFPIDL